MITKKAQLLDLQTAELSNITAGDRNRTGTGS